MAMSMDCDRLVITSAPPGSWIRAFKVSPSSARPLHHRAAVGAGAALGAGVEALEQGWKLLLDVRQLEELLIRQVAAVLAVPLEAIELARFSLALDHQSHRVGAALRRVRYQGRQQEYFAFADRHVGGASVLHRLQHHVAFELVEEFLARVDVVVLAGIRAPNDHDDEIAITENPLVPDRGPQCGPVFVDPAPDIEGLKRWHTGCVLEALFAYVTRSKPGGTTRSRSL